MQRVTGETVGATEQEVSASDQESMAFRSDALRLAWYLSESFLIRTISLQAAILGASTSHRPPQTRISTRSKLASVDQPRLAVRLRSFGHQFFKDRPDRRYWLCCPWFGIRQIDGVI
jgi:hypothetical protein